jgi:hypothetical protein
VTFVATVIVMVAGEVDSDISVDELNKLIKIHNESIAKPANLKCRFTITYGITRSLEDAVLHGPSINVRNADARWVIRGSCELYESVPATDGKITGIKDSRSNLGTSALLGTSLTDGEYRIIYPHPSDAIPHGRASRLAEYDGYVLLTTMFRVWTNTTFLTSVNDKKAHDFALESFGFDAIHFKVYKTGDHELNIRTVLTKNDSELKHISNSIYDISRGVVPTKDEDLYDGKFMRGFFVTEMLKLSNGKFFPKRFVSIKRYIPEDIDISDEEGFRKLLEDDRFVAFEFKIDSVDVDSVPTDDDFKITVPPEVSLFANRDSTRYISLMEGNNVGLHNLKRIADRADLQYQLQKPKSERDIKTVASTKIPIWRVSCFIVGVFLLSMVVCLSLRKSKKIKEGEEE